MKYAELRRQRDAAVRLADSNSSRLNEALGLLRRSDELAKYELLMESLKKAEADPGRELRCSMKIDAGMARAASMTDYRRMKLYAISQMTHQVVRALVEAGVCPVTSETVLDENGRYEKLTLQLRIAK